jgi:hypothetical protein
MYLADISLHNNTLYAIAAAVLIVAGLIWIVRALR